MALNTQVASTAQNAGANAIVALANTGKLQLYDSTGAGQPAAGAAVTTQVKLVEWTLPNPAFGTAAAGVCTANAITGVMPTAAGTATWFRVVSSGAVILWDGSAGTASVNLILGNAAIQSGVLQSITSWTFTLAANAIGATY